MCSPGFTRIAGPILTVANWSGTWPGLVGMLNLNGSLTKMGVPTARSGARDFTDAYFKDGLRQWLADGVVPTIKAMCAILRCSSCRWRTNNWAGAFASELQGAEGDHGRVR